MPTSFTMPPRQEELLISEASGSRSRDVLLTDAASAGLPAGTPVLTTADSAGVLTTFDWHPTGLGQPTGIVLRDLAPGGAQAVVVTRDAEIDGRLVLWPSEATEDDKRLALNGLAERGIVVR